MAVDNETLRLRLETICKGACSGDPEAVAKVKQIRQAAASGDARAVAALAGLRQLYWKKESDTAAWDTAEAIYRQTAKNDPKAKLVVKAIIAKAKGGDQTAKKTWGRMKAIHGSTKPGALFPAGAGEAKVGGYGLPVRDRTGLVVGSQAPTQGFEVIGALKSFLVGRRDLVGRRELVGGPELVGGLPVRAQNGLVVGARRVVFGGLSQNQILELRDLMERAARARVALAIQTSLASNLLKTSTTATQSPAYRASTIRSQAVRQSALQDRGSRYSIAVEPGTDLRATPTPADLLGRYTG